MRWLNSLLVVSMVFSVEAAYVVTQSGRQINGTTISATEDGSVALTTASGQKMTFRKGQYRRAGADKPKALSEAENLLKEGRGGQAVPLLKKVQAEYRFLAWDQAATLLLANHYFETGQFPDAAVGFQALENSNDPAIQARYREALLKSGNVDAMLSVLENDIACGSREAAARAYLMRGDLKAANGEAEGARRDWLKVATFFKAQKELAAEAGERILNSEQGAGK
ncbi:MAG: hypothetical protein U9P12_02035 [Verrucomicrobiota bacterium]|nr:hypothetical protein [Verrucomicrobiota bacterium]